MFDRKKLAAYIDAHAHEHFTGYCAEYVRNGLQAAGIDTASHPADAKDYGPFLESWGFRPIAYTDSSQVGDIAVIQPTTQGIKDGISRAGHIATYDGHRWVSDFFQIDVWGGKYRKDDLPIQIYRNE